MSQNFTHFLARNNCKMCAFCRTILVWPCFAIGQLETFLTPGPLSTFHSSLVWPCLAIGQLETFLTPGALSTFHSPLSTFICQLSTVYEGFPVINPQGAQEVDQQWISSGAKQCSRHLNKKKLDCHSVSFGSDLNKHWSDFQKIALSIFGDEAPKAALSKYSIQCLRP